MKTRQIQFDGVGRMQVVTRELTEPGPKQVLVKIEACGLCTWERYVYAGSEGMPFPFVGGHEIAATVVEKGERVGEHIQVGMPVSVAKWVRCNECEPCRRGYDNHCEGNDAPSGRDYSGPAGFSEYLLCESYEVFPFEGEAPVHFAALAEPLACVLRACNRLNVVEGDTVVVLGAGMMGLLFLKLLRHRGLRVIVVQRSAKRREMAAQMGADAVIDPAESSWVQQVLALTDGKGAAAVVYTAGGGEVLNQCMEATRLGGTVMMYAPTHEEAPNIAGDWIHFKELVVTGALRHDKESFRQAVRLLADGQVDFSDLNLAFGSFEDMAAEMQRADTDRDIHRILLRWG